MWNKFLLEFKISLGKAYSRMPGDLLDKSQWNYDAFNPYAAGGLFCQYKMMQKSRKWLKPWNMRTHLRVLSKSFQMNTNITGFRCFSKIYTVLCFGRKWPRHCEGLKKYILLVTTWTFTKICKKSEKWLKPWHMGTHMRVLSESFPMIINMTGFRWF